MVDGIVEAIARNLDCPAQTTIMKLQEAFDLADSSISLRALLISPF
jgi:hypothetical protein